MILIEVVDVKPIMDEKNSKCIPIFEINSPSKDSNEKGAIWTPCNAVTHSGERQEGTDKKCDGPSTERIATRKAEPPCPPKPKCKPPPPGLSGPPPRSAPPPKAELPWDPRFGPPNSEHNRAVQECL